MMKREKRRGHQVALTGLLYKLDAIQKKFVCFVVYSAGIEGLGHLCRVLCSSAASATGQTTSISFTATFD